MKHDVEEPLIIQLEGHEYSKNEMYFLEVKYERVPRFCSFCGLFGHGQHDCKLPTDLQLMRFSVVMRASSFKKSAS